jgi:hypothetical protein
MVAAPSGRHVIRATLLAAAIAAALLVLFVLPAEYAVDPTGAGKLLGLNSMSKPDSSSVPSGLTATAAITRLKDDRFERELRPFEGMEYKYRAEAGAGFVYAWTATGNVGFEFHGEPDGAPAKYFDSYEKSEGVERSGVFVAAKPGIHGWFWENLTAERIRVTLTTSGLFGDATEFRDGERIRHSIAFREPGK